MAGTTVRAAIISLMVALLLPLSLMLLNGETSIYKTGFDPREFYSLSQEEQAAWKKENVVRVSGFNYFKEIINNPTLLWEWASATIIAFLVIFFSCYLMAWWENKARRV